MFLFHYNQIGSARQIANDLPLNISKRGQITYYSVNFDQHKDYYDFHSTDMVDIFLDVVYHAFESQNLICKLQGYFEIINQERGPEFNLTDKRVWLTNVYHFKYFNQFVRGEIKDEIIKRVIVNRQSGSSWFFKRFNRLNIIVVPVSNELRIITGKILFFILTKKEKIAGSKEISEELEKCKLFEVFEEEKTEFVFEENNLLKNWINVLIL